MKSIIIIALALLAACKKFPGDATWNGIPAEVRTVCSWAYKLGHCVAGGKLYICAHSYEENRIECARMPTTTPEHP